MPCVTHECVVSHVWMSGCTAEKLSHVIGARRRGGEAAARHLSPTQNAWGEMTGLCIPDSNFVGGRQYTAVFFLQGPKLCTDLDRNILYILILKI